MKLILALLSVCLWTLVQSKSLPASESASASASPAAFACSFEDPEDALCGGSQAEADEFDWSVAAGPTPSAETGPDAAQQGQYYLYIEASAPRKRNDAAIYVLPASALPASEPRCVKFHYHMYGFHVASLQLVLLAEGGREILWEMNKQQGTEWLQAENTVELQEGQRLGFLGVVGNGIHGDIALDNIRVEAGACPVEYPVNSPLSPVDVNSTEILYSCSFEPPTNLNGMTQATDDDFDWIMTTESVSLNTGPDAAYDGEYFLMVDGSAPQKKGDIATIYVPRLTYVGGACVHFAYNMYGFHVRRLELLRAGQVEFSRVGQQGKEWIVADVDVTLQEGDQLGFRAEVGGVHGDIALGAVAVSAGPCNAGEAAAN